MDKTPGYVANAAARGSAPRVDTMARMADVCGYALALVPVGDVPPSAIVIDAVRARDSRDSRGAGGA